MKSKNRGIHLISYYIWDTRLQRKFFLIAQSQISIYNRWGNKIFESKRGMYSQTPWDGKFKGEEMPVASYFYIIEFNDGKTVPINGIVSIVK